MNDQEIQQYVDKHVYVRDYKYKNPQVVLIFAQGNEGNAIEIEPVSLIREIRWWLISVVTDTLKDGYKNVDFCVEADDSVFVLRSHSKILSRISRPYVSIGKEKSYVPSDIMSRWVESHCTAISIIRMAEANKPKEAPASEDGLSEHEKLYHEKQGVAYAISAITKKPYEHPGDKVGLGDMVDEVEELVRAERIGAIVDAASVIIPGFKGSLMPMGMDEGETILYLGSKVGEVLFGQWKADREKLVDFAAETFPRAEAGDFPIPKDFNEALEAIRKMIQREIDHAKAEATVAERNRIKEIIDQERGISVLFSGEKRVKKLRRKLEDAERNMLAQRFLSEDLDRIAKSIDPKKED